MLKLGLKELLVVERYILVQMVGATESVIKENKTGGNSFGSQHYIAANGFTFSENEGTDWVTKRGYFTGHSTNGNSNTGEAPDINTPKSINTAATYISPMFLAGYGSTAGKVRVDYIVIKELQLLIIKLELYLQKHIHLVNLKKGLLELKVLILKLYHYKQKQML